MTQFGPGFGEIAEALRRSTVHVVAGRRSGGSGVIWDRGGSIVTNAHVVRDRKLTVRLWDGREFPARAVKSDVRRDLALLHVEGPELAAAPAGDSSALRPGELVVAVGNPLGFTGAVSTGVVHALGPVAGLGPQHYVQATVRLAPGNSGGPLANGAGAVIGINTMVAAGGLGLAVPSNTVRRFLAGTAGRGLGVTVQPVRIAGTGSGIGWIVLEVGAGSAAERSSIQPGDILTGVNDRALLSPDDLADALESVGTVVRLKFLRGGQKREREVAVEVLSGVAA